MSNDAPKVLLLLIRGDDHFYPPRGIWMASWEPLVHLVEESPGYFKTKGNIYSLLETKPHGDNTTANMM